MDFARHTTILSGTMAVNVNPSIDLKASTFAQSNEHPFLVTRHYARVCFFSILVSGLPVFVPDSYLSMPVSRVLTNYSGNEYDSCAYVLMKCTSSNI